MAKTCYLESHKYEGRYMYVSCTQVPDIATNTSRIDWTFVSTGGSATYYATGPTTLKINGEQVFYAEMMGWTARKFPTAKGSVSGSITVPHRSDGSQTVEIVLATAIYTEEVIEKQITWSLDNIDRFATIESAPNFNDEQNPKIKYYNPAGNNIESLQAGLTLVDGTVVAAFRNIPKTSTTYTFNLTNAERNALRAATPNSNTLKVKFCVRSTIGNSTEDSSKTVTLSIINAAPILAPTIVDTNSNTVAVTGNSSILVALHSTAQVTLNAEPQKYATIKSRKIEHGKQVLSKDGTLAIIDSPITLTVVDSRSNQTTMVATNTIIPYINPTCIIGNKLPETNGSFELEVSGLFYNSKIGKTANRITVQYRYKASGSSYSAWTDIEAVTLDENTYNATVSLTGLDYKTVYVFQARVIDVINTNGIRSAAKSVISEPIFDWGQNDFQFHVPVILDDDCDILKKGKPAYLSVADNKIYTKLTDLGLTVFPTTMQSVANALPKNSMIMLDSRDILAEGANEISDLGVVGAGIFVFFRGNTVARMTLLHIYGGTSSTTSFMNYGCYASTNNQVVWVQGERQYDTNPDCRYRTAEDGSIDWINPPMKAGGEYRTTERFNGVPVYCKLVSYTNTATIGSTTSVVDVLIPHGIDDFGQLVRVTGRQMGVNVVPSITSGGANFSVVSVKDEGILLRLNKCTFSSRTWYFSIYYTK